MSGVIASLWNAYGGDVKVLEETDALATSG